MADLLVGAAMRTKQDKKTMEWLISERTRLQEELKEMSEK